MKKKTSLRWKILCYILSFSFILFILLWLFQTVFLDQFYENVRVKQIEKVTETVALNLFDTENLTTIMKEQAKNNEVCIRLLTGGSQNLMTGNPLGCRVNELTDIEIAQLMNKAMQGNDVIIEKLENTITYQTIFGPIVRRNPESYDLISAKLAWEKQSHGQNNFPILVLVSGRMSPVNATVSTLRIQLIYIAGILFVMAVALSYIMTYRIVKPLERITESAKLLAHAKYDVCFEAGGYKEINELSETMNTTSRKLKEVDQMRRDLLANVSHDLRTPLTMIRGYGEMMRDLPQENNAENAQVIVDECQRLTALVNDLLDLSKLQAKQIELKFETFNLTNCILGTCQRINRLLENESMKIDFDYEKECLCYADPARIQQVLDNFLNNAIHYGKKGSIIQVRQKIIEDKVRIEIQDFGEGIPEEKLDLIWDRYYKIDKQHIRSATGSGIGLSIVKEILLLHGAEFGVQSILNEGTTFYFELLIDKH